MKKLLVTGTTGHLGKLVVEQLLKNIVPSNIAILARNQDKADYFKSKGIQFHNGDFGDVVSLEKACSMDKVLLISGPFTRLQQHIHVVDAAQNARVKQLPGLYLFGSVALFFTGAGCDSVSNAKRWGK